MPQDTVKTEKGSLIVFSFGTFEQLEPLDRLAASSSSVTLIDPVFPPQSRPTSVPAGARYEHLPAFPGDSDGEVALRFYSMRGLCSRAAATDQLTALFPGLTETGQRRVSQMGTEPLLAALGALSAPLAVVIDMPGEEQRILDLLAQGKVLDRVETLVLRCGVGQFFAGATKAATLLAQMTARSFDLTYTLDDDPDWPVLVLRADLAARRIAALEARLNAQRQELDAATKLAADHKTALDTRTREHDEAKASLEARAKEIADLTAALAAANKLAEDRRLVLEANARERDEARKDLAARAARLGEAEEQAKTEKAARERESKSNAENRSRLTIAQTEIRRLEGQIELIKDLLLRQPGF